MEDCTNEYKLRVSTTTKRAARRRTCRWWSCEHRFGAIRGGKLAHMSEVPTPEEESIEAELRETPDEDVPVKDEYDGPDPEDDPKGDGADEDQGT